MCFQNPVRHLNIYCGYASSSASVTVEDLARAWASIDGKSDEFDEGRGKSVFDDRTGHYAGYCAEAMEIVARATGYANRRHGAGSGSNG